MKIHITTTTPIGQKCRERAEKAQYAIEANHGICYELVSDPDACEVFFSVFYNKLLPKEFLNGRRCFNFHGGILPEYRGSGTLNFAILNGEKEAGITLHEIDEKIDHGKVIDIRKFPISERDTTQDLFKKAEEAIYFLFAKWFVEILQNTYPRSLQDEYRAKLYTRADLQKTKDLTRFVRAFHTEGYEQAFYINSKGEKIFLQW